jgi:hypothetical protein
MSKLIRRIIKESIDEFDWVDTSTSNLSGKRLYDMMTELFNLNNSMYQVKQFRSGTVDISDDIGVYLEYTIEYFTIDRIREDLSDTINDYNIHPKIRLEYSELAKALEPIIGTMEYYH